MPRWPDRPTSAHSSSTGSWLCATASATTRASSPSPTSTPGSAGHSWRAQSVTTRTPHRATCAKRPESADSYQPTLALPHQIGNEVRPSTVKTWLTIRREPTRVDRSSSRVNAAQRVRTPCATYTLARMTTHTHPSRPCREMQSDSLRRSAKQPQPRSRAPPRSRTSINIAPSLTGNSVEIVRCRLRALLVFRNELANRWDKFHRDIHNRRLRYAGLVFSNGLFLRLRFIVLENATYPLLIPTGGKSRLFHRCFLRCLRRYANAALPCTSIPVITK